MPESCYAIVCVSLKRFDRLDKKKSLNIKPEPEVFFSLLSLNLPKLETLIWTGSNHESFSGFYFIICYTAGDENISFLFNNFLINKY